MSNIGNVQFSYDLLKQAYDTDPAVKKLIKNFDQNKVTLSSGNAVDDLPQVEPSNDQTVSSMAKRATDLG
jgi:cell division protein FtsX